MSNTSQKVSKKELGFLLSVSYPTALKKYAELLQDVECKRSFLTRGDLERLEIIEKNIK